MRLMTLAMSAGIMAVGLLAAPALAQAGAAPNDTIKTIIAKGMTMTIMGFEGEVTYTADGKWTGFDGMASGTYTAEGDKLCITSDMGTACAAYPAGKKSGDSFTVELEGLGETAIKIK